MERMRPIGISVAILFEASPGFGGSIDIRFINPRGSVSQSSLKRVLVSERNAVVNLVKLLMGRNPL